MTEETKKELGAKEYSKLSMIFSSIWIMAGTILIGFGVLKNLSVFDVIYSAVGVVAMWSPTYLSVWLDKIKDIRNGN